MRQTISEQHSAMLAELDRLIVWVNNSDVRESAGLLHMAKLDMQTRVYGISEGELRALSSAVERTLASRCAATKAARCSYPRRRCERPTTLHPLEKTRARD